MSNLLTTDDGRAAVIIAQRYLLERRLSRFFKRNLVIAYNEWLAGDGFNLETIVGELNALHDTEVTNLYRLLALAGGLPATVADMNIYIDPVAGSDTEGDGSETRPYASLWFIDNLPARIDHEVNILFVNDYAHVTDMNISVQFGVDGYLSFIGVGAPTVIGSYEVAATGVLDEGLGRYFQFTGAVGVDPSGEFLMAADGVDVGIAQAIHSQHAADTLITVPGSFLNVAPGDNMNIVRPTRNISFRELSIQCRNTQGWVSLTRDAGRIGFYNLQVQINDSGNSKRDCLLIDNSCAQVMSFCQIIPPSNGTMRITQRAELNTQNGESSAEALSQSGVTNMTVYTQFAKIAGVSVADLDVGKVLSLICEGKARYFSNRGVVHLKANAEVETITCNRIDVENANAKITDCLAQGRANSGAGAGLELWSSRCDVDGFTALNSDNVVSILANSQLSIERSGVDATYSTVTGFGVYLKGIGLVELRDAGARLLAATNAINFVTVNPAVPAAVPAAYGFATDSQLSMVKRLSV